MKYSESANWATAVAYDWRTVLRLWLACSRTLVANGNAANAALVAALVAPLLIRGR